MEAEALAYTLGDPDVAADVLNRAAEGRLPHHEALTRLQQLLGEGRP